MIVLVVWLLLAGYSLAVTGKRNLGISYRVQSDGSIKAVNDKGDEARTYSLMDVVTCAEPSGGLQGQPAQAASQPRTSTSTPRPTPAPVPNPAAILAPITSRIPAVQAPPLPHPPLPNPGDILGELENIERGVVAGARGLVDDARGLLQRVLGGPRFPLPGKAPFPGVNLPRPLL